MVIKHLMQSLLRRFGFALYRYPQGCERLEPHLRLLHAQRGFDTLIDVGANAGEFALAMRAISPRLVIHSIEPNPNALPALSRLAGDDPAWTIHACALGRQPGQAVLHQAAIAAFSSLLPVNALGHRRFPKELASVGEITVEVRTLDELFDPVLRQGVGQRLLLKLDTQGFDLEVLLGGEQVLARADVVVVEASLRGIYQGAPTCIELIEFLGARGFVLSGFFPVSRHTDLSIIEADCVFIRVAGETSSMA